MARIIILATGDPAVTFDEAISVGLLEGHHASGHLVERRAKDAERIEPAVRHA